MQDTTEKNSFFPPINGTSHNSKQDFNEKSSILLSSLFKNNQTKIGKLNGGYTKQNVKY